jgi:hypothetical protein
MIVNPQVEAAKAEFQRTSGRLLKNLEATPDDKLTWSPSATSRTPLEIAFHCAEIISVLHHSIDGQNMMPSANPTEIDAYCRAQEKNTGSREDVVKKIQDTSASYIEWLDKLSDEKLGQTWNSPFGDIPIPVAITLPTYHMEGHIAQLEYVQTIYGDRVWH